MRVVIVDDGSSPPVDESLKEIFPIELKLLETGENWGLLQPETLASSMLRGEWIALLDSDDEWEPSKLKNKVNT